MPGNCLVILPGRKVVEGDTHISFAVGGSLHILVGLVDQHGEIGSEVTVEEWCQLKYLYQCERKKANLDPRFPSAEPHHT